MVEKYFENIGIDNSKRWYRSVSSLKSSFQVNEIKVRLFHVTHQVTTLIRLKAWKPCMKACNFLITQETKVFIKENYF